MMSQATTASAAIQAPPGIVGNAFLHHYYNALHHSPQVVHQFYTDESKLLRAGPSLEEYVETSLGRAEIHEKIMSLDYGDSPAEIRSIDCQESLNGSVLVMVTGAFHSCNSMKRRFAQTFFLAPQENGYFVLNDIFRYIDEACPMAPVHSCNGASDLSPSPGSTVCDKDIEPHAADESGDEHTQQIVEDIDNDSPEQVEASFQLPEADEPHPVLEEESAAVSSEPAITLSMEVTEELPKKSYASILRVPKDSPRVSTKDNPIASAPKTTSAVQGRKAPSNVDRIASLPIQAAQAGQSMAGPMQEEEADGSSQHYNEGDTRSVYVRNLPFSITAKELEDEFAKFGKIKPGGVNLRNQKPVVCFAFVEYEDATFAQIAIEASPISIGGRQAYVQEKRPGSQRAGRGRFPEGRGYQNEGFRGRGYFGGRGVGRGNWQDSGRGTAGVGRVGYGANSNSLYYGNGNGYRRFDSQSANARFPRRGVGNHIGHGTSRGLVSNASV